MPRYDIRAVKAAQGHWDSIFTALAPKLAQAQEKSRQHVPCPVYGGTDGFRLFKHYAEKAMGSATRAELEPTGSTCFVG